MNNKVEITNCCNIEVINAGFKQNNFKTINLNEKHASLSIDMPDCVYSELGQKMFPDGLIPDNYYKKLDMLNALIRSIGDVIDYDDTDWKLSEVTYDSGKDSNYFKCIERSKE